MPATSAEIEPWLYQYRVLLGYWYFINIDSHLHKPEPHMDQWQTGCSCLLNSNLPCSVSKDTEGRMAGQWHRFLLVIFCSTSSVVSRRFPADIIPAWALQRHSLTFVGSLYAPITKPCQPGWPCCAEEYWAQSNTLAVWSFPAQPHRKPPWISTHFRDNVLVSFKC